MPFVPYVRLGDRAIAPGGESRAERWIFLAVVGAVEHKAVGLHLLPCKATDGGRRDERQFGDVFTDDGCGDHAVVPWPFEPTSLVGNHGHVRGSCAYWELNQVDRETRVEVEKV